MKRLIIVSAIFVALASKSYATEQSVLVPQPTAATAQLVTQCEEVAFRPFRSLLAWLRKRREVRQDRRASRHDNSCDDCFNDSCDSCDGCETAEFRPHGSLLLRGAYFAGKGIAKGSYYAARGIAQLATTELYECYVYTKDGKMTKFYHYAKTATWLKHRLWRDARFDGILDIKRQNIFIKYADIQNIAVVAVYKRFEREPTASPDAPTNVPTEAAK